MTAPFFIPNLVLIGSMDGRYPGDHGHMLLAQSFPSRARARLTGCSANIFLRFYDEVVDKRGCIRGVGVSGFYHYCLPRSAGYIMRRCAFYPFVGITYK